MKKLENMPEELREKKHKCSKVLNRVGTISVTIGLISGIVLILFQPGHAELYRYLMKCCFAIGFVSLLVNAVMYFRVE